MDSNPPAAAPQASLQPEDYYLDGPNLVFTAAWHLKRGFCCKSGCRHCPYGLAAAGAPAVPCPDPPAETPPAKG
jgi:hypothetical protein